MSPNHHTKYVDVTNPNFCISKINKCIQHISCVNYFEVFNRKYYFNNGNLSLLNNNSKVEHWVCDLTLGECVTPVRYLRMSETWCVISTGEI